MFMMITSPVHILNFTRSKQKEKRRKREKINTDT